MVILELRQNEESLRHSELETAKEARDFANTGFREVNLLIASDSEVASIWIRGNKGEGLEPVELERYRLLTATWMRQAFGTYNSWEWQREGRGDFLFPIFANQIQGNPGLINALRELNHEQPTQFAERLLALVEGDDT